MNQCAQALYEERLDRFLSMVHGNDGLVAKLAIFQGLWKKYTLLGDDLWKIDPLLYHFAKSMETELILGAARLVESSKRSDGNLSRFLEFCIRCSERISWASGSMPKTIAATHKMKLQAHHETINSIMGRRDKVVAHLDNKYLRDPEAIDRDYPLSQEAVISLVNDIISILREHEHGVKPHTTFHLAQMFEQSVDNMIWNLHTGREHNFGVELRLD